MDKIIHWIPASNLGGCEILLSTFLEGCSGQFENIVITGGRGPAMTLWEEKGATSIIVVEAWWKRNPFKWGKELKSFLSKFDSFCFISWSPSRLPFLSWALKSSRVKNTIVHIGSMVKTTRLHTVLWGIIDLILGNDKKNIFLVACSDYVANSVKTDIYYRNYRSIGVLNGIRSDFFSGIFENKTNQWRFCTVSRLDAVKGHLGMINNITNYYKINPKVTFDIIGEGDMRYQISETINKRGADSYVHLLGNRTDIINILDKHDFFIFNSLPLEGMGIALAEAMSRGLVCIVNDSSLMHEMLGDCGLYFKSEEDFVNILSNLSMSSFDKLSQKTRERANDKFKPSSFSKAYIKILKNYDIH